MPIAMHAPKNLWKFGLLVVCLIAGLFLTWYGFKGRLTYPTLLTFLYLAIVVVLFRTKVVEHPPGLSVPLFGATKLSDFAKGLGCMAGSILWVILLLKVVPDTVIGATILLVPFAALLLTGAFFLIRGFFKNLQQ